MQTENSSAQHKDFIGNIESRFLFYLPTPPSIPKGDLTVQSLIAENGNHWRKILTIAAKLTCGELDWRTYRDSKLLANVGFYFGDHLKKQQSRVHIVCGMKHRVTMGLSQTLYFSACDENEKAWYKINNESNESFYLTPYLDYRQFNNELIDTIKEIITNNAN